MDSHSDRAKQIMFHGDEDLDSEEMDFVTLGMLIIDEIELPPPKPRVYKILGGAGSYSALGARLFSPAPLLSKRVGWIVDQGSDFPPEILQTITSWQTSCLVRKDLSRLTTRGWNGYLSAENQQRTFRYTTPKKRLTADDLAEAPALLHARAIHLCCSPTRCRDLVTDIIALRKETAARSRDDPDVATATTFTCTRPLIIWEPVPDRCVPDELLSCTNTLPLVDVCSPNHAELAGFMGSDGLDPCTGAVDLAAVERACEQLLGSMPLQSYALVIRVGDQGCFVARNGGRARHRGGGGEGKRKRTRPSKWKHQLTRGGLRPDTDMEALLAGLLQDEDGMIAREEMEVDPGLERWFPAYYGPGGKTGRDSAKTEKVVDPTGGGNTFLGGLAVALARGRGLEEACVWGSVAASFAIEQVGVPVLGVDGDGNETWNGVVVEERVSEYQSWLRPSHRSDDMGERESIAAHE